MDDILFLRFQTWYLGKKKEWADKGVLVDEAGLSKWGHQYWIKLHSENGLGNIVLYESNGYYWVDFECGNYGLDDLYQQTGIEYSDKCDLESYIKEFIDYIIWN